MWSHPHPNPLPKGEGDLDPFVAGSVRGDWASRRLRQSWIVARGPGCGQAPALHLSYSILGCRCYEDGGRCRRPVSESIPELAARPRRGTSPRATFSASATFGASILIVVARSGWRRHNKVCKVGVLVGGRVRGSLVPRARADVVSPSPQPSPKRRGRFGSFCCRFSSGRLGISPASAILDCRAWPWLWASPSATCLSRGSRLCSLGRSWLVSPGGHDDPAWGDSRIAPTRDSCGCSGIRPSLIRERDMLPGQSLVPVAAGPPRYEKRELWVGTANWDGGFCHAAPRPQRGTSPRATFSHSAIGHRSTIRHVSPVESRHRG